MASGASSTSRSSETTATTTNTSHSNGEARADAATSKHKRGAKVKPEPQVLVEEEEELSDEEEEEGDGGKPKVRPLYRGASVFSRLTMSWINHLLAVGNKRPLELEDVPPLAKQDSAATSYKILSSRRNQWRADNPEKPPSLGALILRSFWKEIAVTAIFAGLTTLAIYVGPYLVRYFVDFLGGDVEFAHEGYILASIFFVSKIVETITTRQWRLGVEILGIHIRSALTAMVYRKGLKLSSIARQKHTSGEIVNYMAVDVQRVGDFTWYLHDTWLLPLQVILALAILYKNVGLACVATFIATVVSIIVTIPMAKLQEKYQDKLMAAKDERMRKTSESLRNMRILKLQAWEDRYRLKLEEMRKVEYKWLRKTLYSQAFVTFMFWASPIFVAVITFTTSIVLLKEDLTAGRVLAALATFKNLQDPLRNFPDLVSWIAQTRVSLERISGFLELEEFPKDATTDIPDGLTKIAVEIKDGEFCWNPPTPTLSGVELRVEKGMRVAICGAVGAGKSSLLSCILGVIPKTCGEVRVSGSIAYVAQSAWIQSGNIEDNILFGSPKDKDQYRKVLRTCSLERDLKLFSHGDKTIIGERGINLSGGQRQRVQLARALYQDSDIYLLDDPFSALDAETANELFDEYIMYALYGKTVIYVTHQVDFLQEADLILVMKDGKVTQSGKYEELMRAGTDFKALVAAHREAIEAMDIPQSFVDEDIDISNISVTSQSMYENEGNASAEACVQEIIDHSKEIQVVKEEEPAEKEQLVQEEERERGKVSLKVYMSYMTAAYKGALIPVIILAQIAFQVLEIAGNWWMAWANPQTDGAKPRTNNMTLLVVYMALAFGSSCFVFVRAILVATFGLAAAQKLFLSMLRCIFRAAISFYDSTPAGRILNRVSADQNLVDLDIPFRLGSFLATTVQLLGIVGVMAKVTWPVLPVFFPVVVACLWMQKYYMASSRELVRIVSIRKSPIIHLFGESIAGASTIKGFGQEKRFMKRNLVLLDCFARPYFCSAAAIQWLCFRMGLLSTFVFAFFLAYLVAFPGKTIDPSMAGLAVAYGLNLNGRLSRWILSFCKLENKVISIERIHQYCNIPSEPPLHIEDHRPPPSWPKDGEIKLIDLTVRYKENLPTVLHGVSCTFPGGMKIGIVGRTGSGKSTLIQALFRMIEPEFGKIIIDSIDISQIGLHDLRSKLSIIPQEPTLFEGTIRANLDPLEEHKDEEIWRALDKCQLGEIIRQKDTKLESPVTENGDNWSVGERQLLCLGRALLKQAQILVLDEATASVDPATDNLIQRILRTEFANCTVCTIAHRIPTVVDSDLVLVLSDGKVAEFDSPQRLLEDRTSMFAKLVQEYAYRFGSP